MSEFTHLHVHTQYSILDGAASIKGLISKVKKTGMNALAITDHGNMYGVLDFVNEAKKQGIKPIIGCEVYVTDRSRFDKGGKDDRSGFHLILLAKNFEGYKNLSRLVSQGFTEGFYYTPRIDYDLLRKHSEGLIASTACLGGHLPKTITRFNQPVANGDYSNYNFNLEKAEEILQRFIEIFKDDIYLELQNHGYKEQVMVNYGMKVLAEKYNLKLIATNDVHYINKDDFDAHNILICLNTGKDVDDTEGMHYTGNEFLKTPEEMAETFKDFPEALSNTQHIVEKVESFEITRDVLLPVFPIPEGFETEYDYLEHLAWEGARLRWPDMEERPEVKERMDFELATIKWMGFPGYFLIVWDFILEARKMGVRVGPGRGSAAGSAVAYCLSITNIDPIKYKLLFERFLNPERISMPDVDIDFDDEGRGRVIEYVIGKYGKDRVAQIITFGSMAARSAIRDVARVLKLPLTEADRLAKLIPEGPKVSLESAFNDVPELKQAKASGEPLVQKTLSLALTLEGSIRNVGVHACGVIIGPEDLKNFVPLSIAKDSDMPVTQFEGKLVESVGLLKMDFLGLKTLSIINDTLINIKHHHVLDFDIDTLVPDDKKTFELFSRGETTAVFQFESPGMKKYLAELKPDRFEDIIAMNALYRPGPIQYIPNFIDRKFGREKIEYANPVMEEYLADTYGITVYQEQVMLLSQALAGFTKGQADKLRKAMGKKLIAVMNELKDKFIKGCMANGMEKEPVERIWSDWESFAEYAFNKSHSTCYSYVAYQTAYLKAHYPAEFMAANLTHNLSDIKEIAFLIDECKQMKIPVLGPDVNESMHKFTVNKKEEIRFGLGAVKGVGEAAVESLVDEREANGPFTSIFDFVKRINLRACNRRSLEAMAMAGAFDNLGNVHRAQFFYVDKDNSSFIEKLIKYGTNYQTSLSSSQASLFGDLGTEMSIPDPELPKCEPWTKLEQLNKELEVTGFYISGHPLDDYDVEIKNFTNIQIAEFKDDFKPFLGRELTIAGIVSNVEHRTTKTNKPFGAFNIEDKSGMMRVVLFSDDYLNFKQYMMNETPLLIKAKIANRFKQEDNFEFKVSSMQLLSDVLDKQVRAITVLTAYEDVTEDYMTYITDLMSKNRGNTSLKFLIFDASEKTTVEMLSTRIKIQTSDVLRELQQKGIKFRLIA
ncbi:MAG: DNA polymerase III subunit alpha [Bacteroidetes bacterium]|nr:DNA polymerase III subunit alpha [Bacteroidota bacterium]